jgi:hypothetical protein
MMVAAAHGEREWRLGACTMSGLMRLPIHRSWTRGAGTLCFFFCRCCLRAFGFSFGGYSGTPSSLRAGGVQGKDSRARFQPGDISRTTPRRCFRVVNDKGKSVN